MNWVMFILIFGSLLCRPNVKKETSSRGTFRKLKENFMIALGLSLLFGMGWAIGLLASSDLPLAVRYPAEWIFTLATAFLGVYLFALYVLRSPEARKLWKRWLLCQRKKKRVVSFSSSTQRGRFRTLSSTFSSLRGTLRGTRYTPRNSQNTSTIREDNTSISAGPRAIHGHLQPVNLQLVQKLKPEEWYYSEAFSSEPSIILSQSGMEETLKETRDRSSGQNTNADDSVLSVAEEPIDEIDTSDWCYSKVHPSYQFHSDSLLPVSDAFFVQRATSVSATERECYIVENKEVEGTEVTPL